MGSTKHISEILKKRLHNNVNNDNNKIFNNVNSVNSDNSSMGKYALDRKTFTPNTEKTQLAEEIAVFLNDLENYACYLGIVNRVGASGAKRLLRTVKSDIEEKAETQTPVRNPAKYFMWKFKKAFY